MSSLAGEMEGSGGTLGQFGNVVTEMSCSLSQKAKSSIVSSKVPRAKSVSMKGGSSRTVVKDRVESGPWLVGGEYHITLLEISIPCIINRVLTNVADKIGNIESSSV